MSALSRVALTAAGIALGTVVAEILVGQATPDMVAARVRNLAGGGQEEGVTRFVN